MKLVVLSMLGPADLHVVREVTKRWPETTVLRPVAEPNPNAAPKPKNWKKLFTRPWSIVAERVRQRVRGRLGQRVNGAVRERLFGSPTASPELPAHERIPVWAVNAGEHRGALASTRARSALGHRRTAAQAPDLLRAHVGYGQRPPWHCRQVPGRELPLLGDDAAGLGPHRRLAALHRMQASIQVRCFATALSRSTPATRRARSWRSMQRSPAAWFARSWWRASGVGSKVTRRRSVGNSSTTVTGASSPTCGGVYAGASSGTARPACPRALSVTTSRPPPKLGQRGLHHAHPNHDLPHILSG